MTRPARHHPLLRIAAPPLIWGIHFVVIYGLLSIGCAAGWQQTSLAGIDIVRWLLAAVTLPAVAALVWLMLGWRRPGAPEQGGFAARIAAGAALLALVAVIWETMALPLIPSCL